MDERQFPDVFADAVSLAGGPFGLALTFSLSDPSRQGEEGSVNPVVRVRLSPDLARALGQALSQATPSAQADRATSG